MAELTGLMSMLLLALALATTGLADELAPRWGWRLDEEGGTRCEPIAGEIALAIDGADGVASGEGLGTVVAGSIECLVRPIAAGRVELISFADEGAPAGEWSGLALDAELRPVFRVYHYPEAGEARADEPLEVGREHHLAATWSADGLRVYVDGVLRAHSEERKALHAMEGITLGGGEGRAAIEQLAIFTRPLSDATIAEHARERRPLQAPAIGGDGEAQLSAADFASAASMTGGIQEAVDALPAAGGEVYVPPGRYVLKRAVHLRSNVTLRGAGPSTLLVRPADAHSLATAPVAVGDRTIAVEDASGFEVGAEVAFHGKQTGWFATQAIVTAIDGNRVTLDRGVGKGFTPEEGAALSNLYPMVTAEHARGVVIRDLAIDGLQGQPNDGPASFTWEAIHLYNCRDSRVEACQVRNHISDGIGVQGGRGVTVSGCVVENNRGHGLHPGVYVRESTWTGNVARGNTGDGLYFCVAVRDSIVSGNVCADNARHGIGGLGAGQIGDKYNVVSANICARNGRAGIEAILGGDNTIIGNICRDNSQSEPGRYPGILLDRTTDTVVSGNHCLDTQPEPTQSQGVVETGECARNTID